MKFDSLNKKDVEQVRKWRNRDIKGYRTPFKLTQEQQEEFYMNVVSDRRANARYWAIRNVDILIGMIGLDNIQWENGCAEISIVLDPGERGKNFGMTAIDMLLKEGFENLRLKTIYGECYECNESAIGFWNKVIEKYSAYTTKLLNRKFVGGKHYDSLYFSIDLEKYEGVF